MSTGSRKARRRLNVLLVALATATGCLVASTVAPPPAFAGQGPVVATIGSAQVEFTFNDPVDHGGRDTAQLAKVVSLINGAPSGSSILMGLYSITADIVYNAIKAAVGRGVHVYVVHNGKDKNSPDSTPRDLASLLGTNHHWCDHGSSTLARGGGCISTAPTGYMHAKYMLLSQTTDSAGAPRSWVTWFGSPNMTYNSGTDYFNNAVTVYGDPTLFANMFWGFFVPMWGELSYPNNDFYNASTPRGYFGSSTSHVQVYASPERNTDLVVNRLANVNPDRTCRIRVLEASIHNTRSAVVDKLISLHRGGCQVWVAASQIDGAQLSRFKSAGISVHRAPVHDKSMIFYGKYDGSSANRHIIFTGSQNLTSNSLHNDDELFVKLYDVGTTVYTAYYNHFNDAYNTGTPL